MCYRKMILGIGLMSLFLVVEPFSSGEEVAPESSVKSNSDSASSLIVPESPPFIMMRIVRFKGKHKGYTVDVRYPQFKGGSHDAIRKLNREIKLVVDRNIAAEPAPAGAPPGEDTYTYKSDFSESLVTPRFISLNFDFHNYEGGITDWSPKRTDLSTIQTFEA